MSGYKPSPLDTSEVVLSQPLEQLIELLSANVHEVWAFKRMQDGWRFGPSRDDSLKTHPCLVPYDALPASEKDYDRATVKSVVEAIVALGYTIEKK